MEVGLERRSRRERGSSLGEPTFAAVLGMVFVWEKTREGRVLPSFFYSP